MSQEIAQEAGEMSQDLFDKFPEWDGMPEFAQEKQRPFKEITVRFRCESDYIDFAEMIGQNLTTKTKSIWHPVLVRGENRDKVYVGD